MSDQKIPAPDRSEQAPQTPDNKHGPKYDNDTPETWVSGANENATTKPAFDKGIHGGHGPKRSGPANVESWGRKTADERYGRK